MTWIYGVFISIFLETLRVFNEAALYILFGFFISSLLYIFYPREKVIKTFGKGKYGPVIRAALFGIPLPLCSCGVISTAISLKKQGANKGAAISFLISTPETGVDSIAVTYALLDPLMTVFRPIAAFITAVFAGIVTNIITPENGEQKVAPKVCNTCGNSDEDKHTHTNKIKFKRALNYAFVELMGDISGWLTIGIILAGVLSSVIPKDFFEHYVGNGILSMLVMLIVGIPLYICATASTPIAAALILRGLSPGAALVLLLAGPATNMATIMAVSKEMGKKTTAIYLASIAFISVIMGMLLNWIYAYFDVNVLATIGRGTEVTPNSIKIIGSIILAILMLNSIKKK